MSDDDAILAVRVQRIIDRIRLTRPNIAPGLLTLEVLRQIEHDHELRQFYLEQLDSEARREIDPDGHAQRGLR